MEFKVFLLCFAILVAVTTAAKISDKKKTATKYHLKVMDGEKEIDEEIDVDTEKQTETYRVPKTDSSNAGEVTVVYDFKKNLTMQRLSAAKACFLSEGTDNMPKPNALRKSLDQENSPSATVKTDSVSNYEVVSTVNDRSDLSDEMADLCAKFPIYHIQKTTTLRVKRDVHVCYYCYKVYYYCGLNICSYWNCVYFYC